MITAEAIQEAIESTREAPPETEAWAEAEGIDIEAIVKEAIAPWVLKNPFMIFPATPDPQEFLVNAVANLSTGIRLGIYAARKESCPFE